MSVENIVDGLLDAEANIGGIAVISSKGAVAYQTENWNLTNDAQGILALLGGGSSITILGVKYMIVENTPERIIGTNVTGKGHIIVAPFPGGVLVAYIVPTAGPRDALFNVQTFALRLKGKV
jgi:hypothetical protein